MHSDVTQRATIYYIKSKQVRNVIDQLVDIANLRGQSCGVGGCKYSSKDRVLRSRNYYMTGDKKNKYYEGRNKYFLLVDGIHKCYEQ